MKKIISLLLACMLVFGLCACSSSGNTDTTETEGTKRRSLFRLT